MMLGCMKKWWERLMSWLMPGGPKLNKKNRSAVSEGSGPRTKYIKDEIEETLRDLLEKTRGRRSLPVTREKSRSAFIQKQKKQRC